jgi:hypothetical protein
VRKRTAEAATAGRRRVVFRPPPRWDDGPERSIEREETDMHDERLQRLYREATAPQRFALVMRARARGDDAEARELTTRCPTGELEVPDRAFTNALDGSHAMVAHLAASVLYYHGMIVGLEQGAAWCTTTAWMLSDALNVARGWEPEPEHERYASTFIEPARALLVQGIAEYLAGFDAACEQVTDLPGEVVLAAWAPVLLAPLEPYATDLASAEVGPERVRTFTELLVEVWDALT